MQAHGSAVLNGVHRLGLAQLLARPFADAPLTDPGAKAVQLERRERGADAHRAGPVFHQGDAPNPLPAEKT